MNPIRQIIIDRHTHENEVDEEQIKVIFSSDTHLIVEAPAGYGKTMTMVSKIAYLIAMGQVPYPKKVLALTFSINAAFKIRKDVAQELPSILSTTYYVARDVVQTVYATNYHGLCRRILNRFGYLTNRKLSQIDSLKGVGIEANDDERYTKSKLQKNLQAWDITLTNKEIETLIQFTKSIKMASLETDRPTAIKYLSENSNNYLRIVNDRFLPKEYITFDAIILFVRQLFNDHPQIRGFYRNFFPIIIVDEFQDTNILQWALLQDMVGRGDESKNQLFIFGDRVQKIYEFIGAMDGIIDKANLQYVMREIQLRKNHRFKNNQELMRFDVNLRKIAQNPRAPDIETAAPIKVIHAANQDDEANQILAQVKMLLEQDSNCTIAILTRAGKDNQNTIRIVQHFNEQKTTGIDYFFALYSDEDDAYVDFHRECLSALYANNPNCRNFQSLSNCIQVDMKRKSSSETWLSLEILLKTFLEHISKEFRFLSLEEKIDLVIDTLRNKALKQYLMYVANSQVMLSTIHGSKGLEWDYVILPDMEKYSFPSYRGLCRVCTFPANCKLDWNQIRADSDFAQLFNQELNVFYVGGTRARKSLYFAYSDQGLNSSGNLRLNNPSCFLRLQGLQIDR